MNNTQRLVGLLTLLLCIPIFLQAQNSKAKKKIKIGDSYFETSEYSNALIEYEAALKADPEAALPLYKIGRCHLEMVQRHKAEEYFKKAYKKDPEVVGDILFYLGKSSHYNEAFDDAIKYLNQFLNKLTPEENELEIHLTKRLLYECENAKKFIANPIDIQIENMGPKINSKAGDYAPILTSDGKTIVFTSRREGSTGDLTDFSGQYFEDIYISTLENNSWTTPRNIKSINTKGHEATTGLSKDGKTIIVFDGLSGQGDLFYCEFDEVEQDFSRLKKFPNKISAENSYEPSASFSQDGNILFFSSNRKNGFGGLDIYKCIKDDKGNWGDPINLGPTINTEGDEDYPFLADDNATLFFSSTRHEGMGYNDIFKSKLNGNSWSTPKNLGYPINSTSDDLGFMVTENQKYGYFGSVKEGGYGGEDIYRILMPEFVEKKIVKNETPVIEPEPEVEPEVITPKIEDIIVIGNITDRDNNDVITDAKVSILLEDGKEIYQGTSNSEGHIEYAFQPTEELYYTLSVEKDGYLPHSMNIKIPAASVDKLKIEKEIHLVKAPLEEPVVIAKIVEEEISEPEIEEEIIEQPEVIEEEVSETIVAEVKEEVIEEIPEPEIEEEIIEQPEVIEEEVSETIVAEVAEEVIEEIHEEIIEPVKVEPKKRIEPVKKESRKATTTIYVLRNIYFEFDKATIKPSAEEELQKIISYLQEHPNAIGEIAGHTDNLGTHEYNIALSQKRSENVRKYLIT